MSNASKSSSLLSAMTSKLASSAQGTIIEEEVRQLYSRLPTPISYPFYHKNTISYLSYMPDKYLTMLIPIIIYWLASLWFYFLDTAQFPFFEKYRLHEPQEITKRNRVTAKKVVIMVLIQQAIQTVVGLLALDGEEVSRLQVFADHEGNVSAIGVKVARLVTSVFGLSNGVKILSFMGTNLANWIYWWGIPSVQFVWAFFVMDAWQYVIHRAMHESRFLYKHIHSHHHRLYVPYAFGALYNHPLEALLLDSAGGALAHACALMTVRQSFLLFGFSTLKTVCDHGGYAFPVWLDPLHFIFPNTSEYHDVHHQMQGLKYNYSQPFFIHFDVLFSTRMSAEKFQKMREINKKFKAGNSIEVKQASNVDMSKSKDLRQRGITNQKEDQSPEDIVLKQGSNGDPTVTLDAESYRAKAGVTV